MKEPGNEVGGVVVSPLLLGVTGIFRTEKTEKFGFGLELD